MEHKGKRHSIKGYLMAGGIGGSFLLLALLMIFGGYIIAQYRRIYEREHEILTSDYAHKLGHDIDLLESYIKNIYSDNVHYQILKRPQITESQWMQATYYLNNNFRAKAGILDYFGGVFYYDEKWNSLRSEFSNYPYEGDSYRLNQLVKEVVRPLTGERMPCRAVMTYEEETYLVYVLGDHGKQLGYLINLSRYFAERENMQLVIADLAGNILVSQGAGILDGDSAACEIARKGQNSGFTCMISKENVSGQDLQILLVHQDKQLAFWNRIEFWLLFILIPFMAFAVLWNVYRFVRRIIYQPIDHFVHRLTEMKMEELPENFGDTGGESQLEEIRLINEKLDELIAEMRQLEQDKYKKEKEADAALLQYYQLQVSPHFFLNCLNIIASLLHEQDVETVNTMIYSVSRHFRYVFQDYNSQVLLEEELEEVSAYCNIYIIKNSVPLLLQQQVSEETKSYEVPILCIQTFVENSIKYAVSKDRVLSVTIRANRIKDEGRAYLRICIMDNGEGYRPEVLEQLNRPVKEFQYHSRHVGVDNIKYRIFLLYGEKAKLYFYNSPAGGAVTEMLLPQEENESADY
ncbi:MAG: histidine kinase [Lachnospiraceae bacterium]|nr:histidine kinase [Lachnospiraceae bacterium]